MKLHYLFLKNFSNYFNRKPRYFALLADYMSEASEYFIPLDKTGNPSLFDFNPNDNVSAEAIVNDCPFEPDYLIVYTPDGDVSSRWFVKESVRTREGQWRHTLRRDVIAEKRSILWNSPVFAEKGIITNPTNPLLLVNEDANVNQIKSKSELLIKDNTAVPWVIIYLVKGQLGTNHQINIPGSATPDFTIATPIDEWEFARFERYGGTGDYVFARQVSWRYEYHEYLGFTRGKTSAYMSNYDLFGNYQSSWIDEPGVWNPVTNLEIDLLNISLELVKDRLDSGIASNIATLTNRSLAAFGAERTNRLLQYDGKIIKDSTNRYYRINVVRVGSGTEVKNVSGSFPELQSALTQIWRDASGDSIVMPNLYAMDVNMDVERFRVEINEVPGMTVHFNLQDLAGFESDNPLFDVLAIPYGAVEYTNPSEYLHGYITSAQRSLEIASAIATELTSSVVLDIQILPYCPIKIPKANQGGYTGIGAYMLDSDFPMMYIGDSHELGIELTGENGAGDIVFGVKNTSLTFDIPFQIPATAISDKVAKIEDSALQVKYINDCTMCRLCSPNYNGIFEFNLAKNGMSVESFNVDLTLRPHNPYIHVNPNFKFVYGADTDDQRGLICGGDFSVGILDNAWQQYEIQNKNYQAIFDRQIQNMDRNNAINRREAIVGAVTGLFTGAAGGALGGKFMGLNPLVGAAAGAGLSAVGAGFDIANLLERQQEARDFAIDNYNLNLGNVKALPNSITKTNALTLNNKLFPFVEFYECTVQEADAYLDKLRWNGFTLGIITTMSDHSSSDNSNYFRGKLIRLDGSGEDAHFLEAIDEELRKGVYI